MNKKLDLVKILKNVPKGTKLYSPMFGDVFLVLASGDFISVHPGNPNCTHGFNEEGKLSEHGECMLFPSRENRDWSTFTLSKFDIATLKPFNRVLVRDDDMDIWTCGIYSHLYDGSGYRYICTDEGYDQCIPYNNETKHLLGTNQDCPDYYKTW